MKKTYMIPTMKVVKIQSGRLLTETSQIGTGDYEGGGVQTRRGRFSGWEEEADYDE